MPNLKVQDPDTRYVHISAPLKPFFGQEIEIYDLPPEIVPFAE
jgi:hypothetical protein